MRKLSYAAAVSILAMGAGLSTAVHAGKTAADEAFANAALRNLHSLAQAAAQYEQATNDRDQFGCHDAYMDMQKVAHEALTDMHSMSFVPFDAIGDVSILLRISQLEQKGCPSSDDFATRSMLTAAGQAIMALRYDYSIGNRDWYTIGLDGTIKDKNPLRYAESLQDRSYSWVSVRPKGMIFMVELNWKDEMLSQEVDDPSIENSGSNLKMVEVDYRKNPSDRNTTVYFYRSKGIALATMQTAKRHAEAEAKVDAELKASKAKWNKKLTSLPYMVADHDAGFKLVYDVCGDANEKTANGINLCFDDGSHDWSGSTGAPYHWFSDIQSCEDAQIKIYEKKPDDVKIDRGDTFMSACLPAPKMHGHMARGYGMVFTLVTPRAADDDALYAEFRQHGSKTPTVFRTAKACYKAMDTVYLKIPKYLGVDVDGHVLGDRTKSIELTANCVRVY